MKHVERRHFFVRDMVETLKIEVPFVRTVHNLADFFTKAFDAKKFHTCAAASSRPPRHVCCHGCPCPCCAACLKHMAHMIGVHVPVCLHLLMATGTVGAARKGHSRDRHFAGHSQFYPLSPDRVLRLRVRPFARVSWSQFSMKSAFMTLKTRFFFWPRRGGRSQGPRREW